MADEQAEFLIIGAGVIGLALARRLVQAGGDIVLIDANSSFGMETSSRNSEVIHAGIYYPQDSLKAKLCSSGAKMLYQFCQDHGVKTHPCGKLIVATSKDQLPQLESIKANGEATNGGANGVANLEIVEGQRLKEMEPHLKAVAALHSPLTGVVDSHGYMAALEHDIESHGGTIAYLSRFVEASQTQGGYRAKIDSQGQMMTLFCRHIINAAGHGGRKVALAIEGIAHDTIPRFYMAKGQYFTCSRKPPFSHLIYPLPSGGGLGVHLTFDAGGGARFGPDIQWVEEENYDVNPADRDKFFAMISSYWPELKAEDLTPAWAGLRPKIVADGSVFQDFTIHDASTHGAKGVVCLYGIDSPGLTSSLALADYVAEGIT